jgi:hypothetical protein
MASVNITVDSQAKTVVSGATNHGAIAKLITPTTNAVPRLRIPALNQIFSPGDNITLKGGEIITSGLN